METEEKSMVKNLLHFRFETSTVFRAVQLLNSLVHKTGQDAEERGDVTKSHVIRGADFGETEDKTVDGFVYYEGPETGTRAFMRVVETTAREVKEVKIVRD